MQGDIFVELVKVRKRIADELGYESYTDFAYSEMGYDYAKEDTVALLSEFKNTVYPVYLTLYNRAFRSYFYSNKPSESSYDTTANSLYAVYTKLDGEVGEAYSYMLKCGLYDIGKYKAGRY